MEISGPGHPLTQTTLYAQLKGDHTPANEPGFFPDVILGARSRIQPAADL